MVDQATQNGCSAESTLVTKADASQDGSAKEAFVPLNIEDIRKILPHRYPFLLVDRIIEFQDNERIVGIKAVSANEAFFQGHFPFRSVMPGVLIMEAMAQVGAAMAAMSSKGVPSNKTLFLAGANDFRWKKPVIPGDVMRIEMSFSKKRPPVWKMRGTVTVDGQIVATGEVTASEVES
jgi:3-hydroxyacyl-[acyl-carrier-protein] dehydratase